MISAKHFGDVLPHLYALNFTSGQLSLPSTLHLDFDIFLPGTGWYAPEGDAGCWFRWIGATGEGLITLLIDRTTPLSCQMAVYTVADVNFLKTLKIYCDDIQLNCTTYPSRGRHFISYVLPIRLGESGLTELRFLCREHIRTENDPRHLSIAFESMDLIHADTTKIASEPQFSIKATVSRLLTDFIADAAESNTTLPINLTIPVIGPIRRINSRSRSAAMEVGW